MKDLFPKVNMAEIEYAQLSQAIKEVYAELKLVYMPTQVWTLQLAIGLLPDFIHTGSQDP